MIAALQEQLVKLLPAASTELSGNHKGGVFIGELHVAALMSHSLIVPVKHPMCCSRFLESIAAGLSFPILAIPPAYHVLRAPKICFCIKVQSIAAVRRVA